MFASLLKNSDSFDNFVRAAMMGAEFTVLSTGQLAPVFTLLARVNPESGRKEECAIPIGFPDLRLEDETHRALVRARLKELIARLDAYALVMVSPAIMADDNSKDDVEYDGVLVWSEHERFGASGHGAIIVDTDGGREVRDWRSTTGGLPDPQMQGFIQPKGA